MNRRVWDVREEAEGKSGRAAKFHTEATGKGASRGSECAPLQAPQ